MRLLKYRSPLRLRLRAVQAVGGVSVKRVRLVRKDGSAVSPVIATILMVAITVVLAAVLYVMVSNYITPLGETRPLVRFDPTVALTSGNATIEVVAASEPQFAPANYKVNLQVGAATGAAIAMPSVSGAFVSIVVDGTTYRVQWTDLGGDATVSGGDRFLVTGNGIPLPAATSFTFFLLWSDGDLIAKGSWQTS